jgi:hypothetical protein
VTRVAEVHGVRVIGAREFAARLLAPVAPARPPEELRDVRLSEAEVAEWLRIFGEPPEELNDEPPEAPASIPPAEPNPHARPARAKKSRRRRGA